MDDTDGSECVFSEGELARRQERVRGALADRGLDVGLFTGPENLFYLTGQQTPGYYTFQALLMPADGEPVFLIRQLEALNCRANTRGVPLVTYEDDETAADAAARVIGEHGFANARLGIEKSGWFIPPRLFEALGERLGTVADISGIVERLREVKSPEEIAFLERSAAYTDAGLNAGLAAIAVGATENDIVAAMLSAAVAAGSEYFGMEPLVSSGPRSGVPHGTWRRRRLGPGDPAFLEMAGVHNRYHTALMRSAWLGEPPAEALAMHATCCAALDAALEALRPGNTAAAVHAACQAVIDNAGYTDAFRKRTGYSTGISFAPDWGEGNVLSLFRGVDRVLEPGMAFHIPPALRDYGRYTVGVSETAVLTETGCRTLGTVTRDLHIVPC
ncbi:MAG: Xaa-Pro peptidase family protein [Pseudomonadota bacterium]